MSAHARRALGQHRLGWDTREVKSAGRQLLGHWGETSSQRVQSGASQRVSHAAAGTGSHEGSLAVCVRYKI